MSNTGIFETSIRKFLPTNETIWSKDVTIMVSHAYDVDRLRERCAQDSRDIAASFERFSKNVLDGQFWGEPSPQGPFELARNMAILQGYTNLFKEKVRITLSDEDRRAFWAMVEEAFESAQQ